MRRWEEIFTATDREVLQGSGMGWKQEYGKNPALLIIDVTTLGVGPNKPILEAVKETPVGCGEVGWRAVVNIQKLLEACRRNGIPVIYCLPDTHTRRASRMPEEKLPKGQTAAEAVKQDTARTHEILQPIAPLNSELVIPKTRPSIFFGTPLVSCLRAMDVDTLLITGTTTSGCVRAAAVDGFSYGYRCFVVEECSFDRFELSHLVNLFDINAKYADVVSLEEVLQYITEVGQVKKKL